MKTSIELPRFAITIWQPWAWLIVHGYKDIENRDWYTNFRGEICIHAGKKFDPYWTDRDTYETSAIIKKVMPITELQYGGIIGTAEIVGCVTESDSIWFAGGFGFVLENAKPIEFIPMQGNRKIWGVKL